MSLIESKKQFDSISEKLVFAKNNYVDAIAEHSEVLEDIIEQSNIELNAIFKKMSELESAGDSTQFLDIKYRIDVVKDIIDEAMQQIKINKAKLVALRCV